MGDVYTPGSGVCGFFCSEEKVEFFAFFEMLDTLGDVAIRLFFMPMTL